VRSALKVEVMNLVVMVIVVVVVEVVDVWFVSGFGFESGGRRCMMMCDDDDHLCDDCNASAFSPKLPVDLALQVVICDCSHSGIFVPKIHAAK
jgi:hypothetical protein